MILLHPISASGLQQQLSHSGIFSIGYGSKVDALGCGY